MKQKKKKLDRRKLNKIKTKEKHFLVKLSMYVVKKFKGKTLKALEVAYLRCWGQSAASWAVSSSSFLPGYHRDQPCPCGWPETWTAECWDSYLALNPKKHKAKMITIVTVPGWT